MRHSILAASAIFLSAGFGFAQPAAAQAQNRTIHVCVIKDSTLTEVAATYNRERRDTTVGRVPFSEAYPATVPPYLWHAKWFWEARPIQLADGVTYTSSGLPRMLEASALKLWQTMDGIPVFVTRVDTLVGKYHKHVYLPVKPGCSFAPYKLAK